MLININYTNMLAKIFTGLLVVAIATETAELNEVTATPTVESPKVEINNFTMHPWGVVDWSAGFIMGSYIPLLKMSSPKPGNCFAYFFNWGVGHIEFASYFNKEFDINYYGSWLGLGLKMLLTVYDTYKTTYYCLKELAYSKEVAEEPVFEEWKSFDVPTVGAEAGKLDIEGIVMTFVTLGITGYKIYKYYKSEYYYWGFGFAIGKSATMIL